MQTLSSTQLPIFFLKNNFAAGSTTETEPCQRISDPAKLCRQGLKPHMFWDILEFGAVWRTRTDKDGHQNLWKISVPMPASTHGGRVERSGQSGIGAIFVLSGRLRIG